MLNIKGMLNNPLTHLGLGILSQSGPSQYPRGLSGIGTGALQGMQSYQAQQQADIANRLGQVKLGQAMGILPVPQEPTSLQRNVAAIMSLPEDDPTRQFMEQIMLKPQVSIDQRPAPPAGYRYTAEGDLEAVTGGPATRFSESEAKQRAQAEVGMRLLDEVDTLVNAGAETGTAAWVRANAASTPLLSWTVNLTPEEAKIASNLEMLSNIMLAAQRGAQVGPEEQKRYDKQLPRLGQNDKLFAANLTATKRNLKELTEKIRKLRTGADGGKGGGGRKRYNPATGRLE